MKIVWLQTDPGLDKKFVNPWDKVVHTKAVPGIER